MRGFIRATGVLLASMALMAMSACTSTKEAYKAAEAPDEYAYVLAEHYSILVEQAADLAAKPTTPPEVVKAMQAADAKAKPVVLKLRTLRDAYVALKTAESEADLQAALDEVVPLIADLIRAVQSARGRASTTLEHKIFEHELHLRRAA